MGTASLGNCSDDGLGKALGELVELFVSHSRKRKKEISDARSVRVGLRKKEKERKEKVVQEEGEKKEKWKKKERKRRKKKKKERKEKKADSNDVINTGGGGATWRPRSRFGSRF